jgi:hypothetical protein
VARCAFLKHSIGNLDEMSVVAVASWPFRSMVQLIPGDASKSLGCDAHRPWIRGLSSCAAIVLGFTELSA